MDCCDWFTRNVTKGMNEHLLEIALKLYEVSLENLFWQIVSFFIDFRNFMCLRVKWELLHGCGKAFVDKNALLFLTTSFVCIN